VVCDYGPEGIKRVSRLVDSNNRWENVTSNTDNAWWGKRPRRHSPITGKVKTTHLIKPVYISGYLSTLLHFMAISE
jgi:hypothetical protein